MLNAFKGSVYMVNYYYVLVLAMTVILDHSLLHLNVGLAGNQTECLLDSGATHNFISS